MRAVVTVLLILLGSHTAFAQYRGCANLGALNRRLAGQIVDFTHNHGRDNRLYSPILGRPRDLYVYLPPGYSPQRAYPLLLVFHMAYTDEHFFTSKSAVEQIDGLIAAGCVPPVVVACPDGTIDGRDRMRSPHSFYINGVQGRFEDHVMFEVVPFLMTHFSIRPERQAHAVLGLSGGGLGAMNLALKHRGFFGAVATLASPLNLRYSNCDGDSREDFDPRTFRWRTDYDPDEAIGRFKFGLQRTRARVYIEPVFGAGPDVPSLVIRENPADLLFRTGLQPGELAIFVHYPGRDNFNFDAQDRSFVWLASSRGIAVTEVCAPGQRHNLRYFNRNQIAAFLWLAGVLLPPVPVAGCSGPPTLAGVGP